MNVNHIVQYDFIATFEIQQKHSSTAMSDFLWRKVLL